MKNFVLTLALICFSLLASAQNKVKAKCTFWTPPSLCEISDTLNIPMQARGKDVKWNILTCQQINSSNELQGIHVRFTSKSVSTFSIESRFKNISLKKKDSDKTYHPYAILWYGTEYNDKSCKMVSFIGYLTSQFTAKEYTVTYELNKPYDLIMLFYRAAPGDKIVIDNFLEVEIEKFLPVANL
jgi:hypothetical protein